MREKGNVDRDVMEKRKVGHYRVEIPTPGHIYHREDMLNHKKVPEHQYEMYNAGEYRVDRDVHRGDHRAMREYSPCEDPYYLCSHGGLQQEITERMCNAKRPRATKRRKNYSGPVRRVQNPQTMNSLHKYLLNINIHDKWLKVAVVSQALSCACNIEEPSSFSYSMEMKNFEEFSIFTLVFALSYLRRTTPPSVRSMDSFVMLFLSCNIIAHKYQEDYNTMNSKYSEVWGIQLESINAMEAQILGRLNYSLNVDYTEIVSILNERMYYLKNMRIR